MGGFALIPAMWGLRPGRGTERHEEPQAEMAKNPQDSVIPKLEDITKYWRTIVEVASSERSSHHPGVGEDIGAWVSYAAARRKSKEREKFGKVR